MIRATTCTHRRIKNGAVVPLACLREFLQELQSCINTERSQRHDITTQMRIVLGLANRTHEDLQQLCIVSDSVFRFGLSFSFGLTARQLLFPLLPLLEMLVGIHSFCISGRAPVSSGYV